MPIIPEVNWKDLETKGFIHVRGYLSETELDACRADYNIQPVDANNRNNAISVASDCATSTLQESFEELMARVRTHTDIRVDCYLGSYYFATTRGVFPWHQDYESYFATQNHYDYLNLFIPVVKPRTDKSNLCIVPFDVLERESPKTFRRVVGRGACMAYDLGDRQLLFQADLGMAHVMPVKLDRLAYTPQLAAGDLLIVRGDIFHRTQDGDTERVALSVRLCDGNTIVRRAQLADGGLAKMQTMSQNMAMYELMFRAFDRANHDELPYGELLRLMKEGIGHAPVLRETPKRYLLRQKVRSRVLLSSARKVVNELVRNRALVKYHQRQARKAEARAAHSAQSVA